MPEISSSDLWDRYVRGTEPEAIIALGQDGIERYINFRRDCHYIETGEGDGVAMTAAQIGARLLNHALAWVEGREVLGRKRK